MRPLLPLCLCAIVSFAADLPVRRVILYKHGIGYFERGGRLAPGESARLEFKASEMNDVLKSLTIRDTSGAGVAGLRYDSMDPLSRKLAEFPFRLGDNQALAAMLDQLKGAKVELQLGGQTVAGTIAGGRVVQGDERRPSREQIILLGDSGELRTIDLEAAASVRFSDPKLQRQFRDYLATLEAARSQEKRSVYIDSTGSQARDIVASYAIPAAVWKSSYRLALTGTANTLEGWAIVDNTTSEDWNGVSLALVSGRPVSFISQLYPPRYVNRPQADLPEDRASAPMLHEGAYGVVGGVPGGVPGGTAGGVIGGIVGSLPAAAPPPPPAPQVRQFDAGALRTGKALPREMAAAESTVTVNAAAQEVGELFEYGLTQPVTIRKSESAMLPFLQQKIDARKLLIWADRSTQHPSNAAELLNSTGKTLAGGPITIYDGGAYAGEALMETLKAGDKRLVSYAIDLGTRITTAFDSKEAVVREVHAANGILNTRTAVAETTTYTIMNVDQKAKTLIVEHPLRADYRLLDRKPSEKTSAAYRFEVKLRAASTETFPVSEERLLEESYQISTLTPADILVYVRNKTISEAARKQLDLIAQRKSQLSELDQQIAETKGHINEASADQDRLRRNIDSLNRVASQQQQVQEYARKLADQEIQIAKLRDQQAEAQRRGTALQREIEALIQNLSF